nr:MAG TPA: hypothetical protein [Caudoviricetes sp.]
MIENWNRVIGKQSMVLASSMHHPKPSYFPSVSVIE